MTVRTITTDERFQVWADIVGHEHTKYMVNSYSDPNTAEKCRAVLAANVPASYITRAWIVDREIGAQALEFKDPNRWDDPMTGY